MTIYAVASPPQAPLALLAQAAKPPKGESTAASRAARQCLSVHVHAKDGVCKVWPISYLPGDLQRRVHDHLRQVRATLG